MYRENPEQADDRQYYDYHLDRNGSSLEGDKEALRQPLVRRSLKFDYSFGCLSKEGYRHFPMLYFAYGSNGFTICLIGATITCKLW